MLTFSASAYGRVAHLAVYVKNGNIDEQTVKKMSVHLDVWRNVSSVMPVLLVVPF